MKKYIIFAHQFTLMIVTKDTKISKILKENPEAIDVIAGLNSNFKKLQNPILRRSLATRVSVKDAARIGKVSINAFLKALQDTGFEVEFVPENAQKEAEISIMPPDFSNKEIVTLDVRPIINEGKDPFGYINKTAKNIKPEQILLIINDFEPIPLIDYLTNKNFVHWMRLDEEGNYLTYFKLNCKKPGLLQRLFGKKNIPCRYHDTLSKKEKEPATETQKITNNQSADFERIKKKYESNLVEIDVRHLEMPMPMKTILEKIEILKPDQALFVHHKRMPQFLLPELEKRQFEFVAKQIEADYTYLIIYKKQETN